MRRDIYDRWLAILVAFVVAVLIGSVLTHSFYN